MYLIKQPINKKLNEMLEEVLNSEMIEEGIEQNKRLEKLNKTAIKQLSILYNDNNIKKIEYIDKLIIENR